MSDAEVQSRLAKVVHVIDPDMAYAPIEVVINRGAAAGVKTGDRFLVFGDGPMISGFIRTAKVTEEEFAPEVTAPFDHVRLGDQAKPI